MTHLSEDQAPIDRRERWRIIRAFSIGLFFYYAILLIIYYVHETYSANQQIPIPQALVSEKYSLMIALREYRKEHKAYPLLPDNPIGDVKKQLVSGGYLAPGPDADEDARYVSLDGKSYGLMFHNPRGGTPCLVEVDVKGTRWWGAPKCPF
jgi:hypothetical protein